MIDRLITEHTQGHLVAPDGSLLERPTRILDLDSAKALRAYFLWAMRNQLEPELVCGDCFDHTRESKAIYEINDQQIVIACGCSLRFYQGVTALPTITPEKTLPTDSADVARVILSDATAKILRTYKKLVLERLNLKELLRCNACFALGYSDGCHAQVLTNSIRITCRCSDRMFTGSTL